MAAATSRRGSRPQTPGWRVSLVIWETPRAAFASSARPRRSPIVVYGWVMALSAAALLAARHGEAEDAQTAAALRFARAVVAARGRVDAAALADARVAGWSEGALLEMVAQVALNTFSNYVSLVAEPELDFPSASPLDPR